MQNLGTLVHFNILAVKGNNHARIYYVAQNNQNNNTNIIEIRNNNNANNNNNNNNNFFAQEIQIVTQLNNANCPYLLRCIEYGNGQLVLNNQNPINEAYIVYENAPNFSLFDYINVERLTENQAKLLFKKILSGFQVMHYSNFCHRDITAENILFDANYNPKIYGFYASCNNANNLQGAFGSLRYTAPEIINNHPYDGFKADIFSLGQLLFNMVTGMFGFNSSGDNDQQYFLIRNNQFENYWNLGPFQNLNLSHEFKDLYWRMVAYNPNERPTIEEILTSLWMNEITNLNQDELNTLEQEIRTELHNREAAI